MMRGRCGARWVSLSVGVATLGAMVACSGTTGGQPRAMTPMGEFGGGGTPGPTPEAIDLSIDQRVARTVATPEVIDTRDFEVQIAVRPFEGQPRTTDVDRPEESEELEVPVGPANDLAVGGLTASRRVGPVSLFPGISQTPWSPPDPSIAVGPEHIVETVNMAIAFYEKDGTLLFSQNLDSTGSPGFFETVGGGNFTFDPKCFFDPHSGRFVVVALEVYGNSNEAWIDIAVSDDGDPTGVWYKYRTWAVIAANGSNYWVDYPGFGFDQDAFYVTGNLFKLNGGGPGFAGALYRIFPKAPVLVGDPVALSDIRVGSSGSVQASQGLGSPTRTYFLSRDSSTSLKIQTINDPLGTPTFSQTTVSVPSQSGPNQGAPNLGGGTIDTLDGRLMNVSWRDGLLHAAHGIDVGSRTESRWYEIATNGWPDAGTPVLVQSGNISPGAGVHTFFPAIASDTFGNVAMVTGMSSSSTYASVQATGRKSGDAPGTMGELEELVVGNATANGRWGDYFDIALDPTDGRTFWMVGEHQSPGGWRTWIGSFSIGCPGDFNGDGALDVLDFVAFQIAWLSGEAPADCDGNGLFDVLDFVCFQNAFSAGCG